MKSYDVTRLPSMIELGYDGENNWRPNRFDCSSLLANHPNGTISLWLLPNGEEHAFPVALERDGNTVVWTPLSEEMTAATGALQLVCTDGTDVGKSAVVLFRVDESILPGAAHPAAVPSWATQVMEQYQDAIEHYPQIIDSTWRVWDVDNETWEDTGVSAQGADGEDGHSPYIALNGHWMVYSDSTHEWIDTGVSASVDEAVIANAVAAYLDEHPITVIETDPTVPQWAKNPTKPTYTASEVGALPADTVIPPTVTEQTVSGWGFTKNTGDYTKPASGIPKTDLASDVQEVLDSAITPGNFGSYLNNEDKMVFMLPVSGTTVTLNTSFINVYYAYASSRDTVFAILIGGTAQNPVGLILSPKQTDTQNYSITLGGEYNGNRYFVTLSAASENASPMTGTLVVEPIAELPTVTSTDNGKFLRVVNGAWAAETVQTWQGGSY